MSTTSMMIVNVATIIGAYFLYTSGTIDMVQEWRLKTSTADIWALVAPTAYRCDNDLHRMNSKFLSYDPIIVYIENFLTPYEAKHLRDLAEPRYTASVVEDQPSNRNEAQYVQKDIRNSQTAWLGSPDPVVDCVRARAAVFQGYASNDTMDVLAAIKYGEGGEFRVHYDFHGDAPQPIDRKTSFFAILEASPDLQGGATYFPLVEKLAWNSLLPQTWCRFIDCAAKGLFVKPIPGNALFWVNFREDGRAHEATAHSGEPVVKGTKVGMNIWTYDHILD